MGRPGDGWDGSSPASCLQRLISFLLKDNDLTACAGVVCVGRARCMCRSRHGELLQQRLPEFSTTVPSSCARPVARLLLVLPNLLYRL